MPKYLFNDEPATGNALPTGQLANLSRDKESNFVATAPSGYVQPRQAVPLPKDLDPNTVNEGFVKGYLAGQENQRADISLGMDQTKLNMVQEQQSWERTDREQKRAINDGMAYAARDGGFAGVVDYLRSVDPERAMQFQGAKDQMDQSMMKTNIMKAALPNEYAKIMVEGYGIMGNMGQALLNAKPEDRGAMYSNMLPILKTINPDAPNTLDAKATSMFMLAAAQATPANQLFVNNNLVRKADSQMGKLLADRQSIVARGGETTDIDTQIQKLRDEATKTHLDTAQLQLKLANGQSDASSAVTQGTEAINSNLEKSSSTLGYFKALDAYKSASSSITLLQADPTNAYAQTQLAIAFAKANNSGALTDKDAERALTATSYQALYKKAQSIMNGEKVFLNPEEQKNIVSIFNNNINTNLASQLSLESQYKESANQYGKGTVNWDAVRLPSNQYYAIKNTAEGQIGSIKGASQGASPMSAPPQAVSDVINNPQLLPQFISKYGYDPSKQRGPSNAGQ